MTDRKRPGQGLHQTLLGEIVAHIAKPPGGVKTLFAIIGDDTRSLLPTMLQCMKAEGYEVGRICDTNNAEDPAFLVKFVVIEGMRGKTFGACHGVVSLN